MTRRRAALRFAAAITAMAFLAPAGADTWPSKPIHLVVGYPAGGSTDLLARLIAQKIAPALGQPIVVDNKPGATGNIGSAFVARAEPDGYTLLFTNSGPGAVSYGLQKNPSFHPVKDFVPIAAVADMPLIMAGPGNGRFADLAAMLAYGKANPGKLNFATTGNGSVSHVVTELFDSVVGIKATHVPYKGGAQTAPAVIGGEVDYFFSVPSDILPYLPSGRMKAYSIATLAPSPLAVGVPTLASVGAPGFEASVWYGLLAPRGTPSTVVAELNRQVNAALAQPDVRATIASLASVPIAGSPADFASRIEKDVDTWTRVIRDNNITAE